MLPTKEAVIMEKLDMNLYLKNLNSSRTGKKVLLDEFCQISGFHRKHSIHLLNRKSTRKKPKETRGRKPIYDHQALLKPLRDIWIATDQMCFTRSKVNDEVPTSTVRRWRLPMFGGS